MDLARSGAAVRPVHAQRRSAGQCGPCARTVALAEPGDPCAPPQRPARRAAQHPGPVFCDRGVADVPGYFRLIGLPVLWHWGGQLLLGPHFPTTNALLDDWNQHFHYFTLFVTGYVLCSQTQFWTSLLHQRRLTLALALVLTTVLYAVYWTTDYDPEGWELSLYFLIATTNAWCILLTIFGHGYRYLHFPNRFLTYANEAVYPFYILHQTVIVCLAYPLIDLTLPMEVKFVYLSFATFVICWVLYHFLIKRVSVLRVLFGMKGLEKKVVALPPVEGGGV